MVACEGTVFYIMCPQLDCVLHAIKMRLVPGWENGIRSAVTTNTPLVTRSSNNIKEKTGKKMLLKNNDNRKVFIKDN